MHKRLILSLYLVHPQRGSCYLSSTRLPRPPLLPPLLSLYVIRHVLFFPSTIRHGEHPPTPQKKTTHTLFGCNFPRVFDEALTHHAESTSPLSDWLGGLGNCFIARHGRWVEKKKEERSPFQISTLTVTTPNPLPCLGKCLSIAILPP